MATYPSTEGLTEKYREAEARMHWWADRRDDFLRKYPDEFVAVVNGAVVAHHRDLRDLRRLLADASLEMSDDHVWVHFIDASPGRLIL